jgi:hypothetical protein
VVFERPASISGFLGWENSGGDLDRKNNSFHFRVSIPICPERSQSSKDFVSAVIVSIFLNPMLYWWHSVHSVPRYLMMLSGKLTLRSFNPHEMVSVHNRGLCFSQAQSLKPNKDKSSYSCRESKPGQCSLLIHEFNCQDVEWEVFCHCVSIQGPPLWSAGQSSWLQIQRSRVRFPALPHFLRSNGSGTGFTQPRENNWGATWKESSGSGLENRN